MRYNQICVSPSLHQKDEEGDCDDAEICLDFLDIIEPLESDYYEYLRGNGCTHDGGPLWVSVPIVDIPDHSYEEVDIVARFY